MEPTLQKSLNRTTGKSVTVMTTSTVLLVSRPFSTPVSKGFNIGSQVDEDWCVSI